MRRSDIQDAGAARTPTRGQGQSPRARYVVEVEEDTYVRRANRIRIQHRHGEVVTVIEIVSPGNKDSANERSPFIIKRCSWKRKRRY